MSLLTLSLSCVVATATLCASPVVLARADPAAPAPAALTAFPAAASSMKTAGLNAEQVYAILLGEIAGRRGDMSTAFTQYFKAAQLTQAPQMAELAARVAIRSEDYDAADQAVRLWLTLAPNAPMAQQVAAFLRIHAEDQEGALIHLNRLIELSEGANETVYDDAAALIARASTPELQLRLMQALVTQFPESAEAQQALASLAAGISQFAIADKAARRALELRPEWNKPRLFLVRLLLTQDKRTEARQLLESFIVNTPNDLAMQMLYGQFLIEEKEFTSARAVFEQLLNSQPKAPEALFAAGILSLQLNEFNRAQAYFTRLYDTGERQNDAAFYLGQAAEQMNDVAAALNWYQKVEENHVAEAQMRIAVLRAAAGDVAAAREMLQQLRIDSPEDAVMSTLVEAEILENAHQAEEAMQVLNAALNEQPDAVDLLYARGLLAINLGQLERGEQDLQQIIAVDAENANALNALGYTLADRTDRYTEALGYIERAYKLKPDEPAILDSLGWVHYRLGHLETARDYLRQALAAFNDGEIAAHLGEVLWAMGQQTEAWTVWNASLAAHPDDADLQKVIERHRVLKTEANSNNAKGTPK
ncbi:tetratricopeptide repeat protein [Chromatium okenii]|uniref:tetratricopeptide repeat protein n=1 Tax=Chromatium okenii TaxID=61644 RepID=UPI0026EECE06|nr:tetratricopeptide repeat protein [Chromatium okenii]MBV5310331.1 tetratricopeptide repeat protein [Chromatium okenii]